MFKKSFVFCLVLFCVSFDTSWGQYLTEQKLTAKSFQLNGITVGTIVSKNFFKEYKKQTDEYNIYFYKDSLLFKTEKVNDGYKILSISTDDLKYSIANGVSIGDSFFILCQNFNFPQIEHTYARGDKKSIKYWGREQDGAYSLIFGQLKEAPYSYYDIYVTPNGIIKFISVSLPAHSLSPSFYYMKIKDILEPNSSHY